jgi:hypothetical protein
MEQSAPALRIVLLWRQAAELHHRRAWTRHGGQSRLSIVDAQGKRIARLGGEEGPGLESGKFLAPHGIALDSRGDIYVGEVGVTDWKTNFPDEEMPAVVRATRCLQKLERVQEGR